MREEKAMPMDALKPGMSLARDVTDAAGNCLLPAGTALTELLLQRLRQRDGLAQVWVLADSAMSAQEKAAKRAQIEATLQARFAPVMERPLMQQLYEVTLDYLSESLR